MSYTVKKYRQKKQRKQIKSWNEIFVWFKTCFWFLQFLKNGFAENSLGGIFW